MRNQIGREGTRQALAVAMLLCITALLASCASPLDRLRGIQPVIVGQESLTAQVSTLSGTPTLLSKQAVTIAERYVTSWAQAKSITPRYVALTLRSTQGNVAWGIRRHPVWLVEFAGARYAPAAYPESDCACDRLFQPPNTAVAIDAQTGALVMNYGFS